MSEPLAQAANGRARHSQADVLAAGLVYVAVTLVIMYPVSANPLTLLPVHAYDTYQHLWALWWYRYAALHGLFPGQASALYAPTGVYFPMLWTWATSLAPGILLQPLLGLIGTYNLLAMASFPLSGVAMYLLARDVTGSRMGALFAGLVFAFAPGRTIRLVGHFLLLQTFWLPIYALLLLRIFRRPGWKTAVLCGFSLAMVCLSHMLFAAYFALPVTGVALVYHWFSSHDPLQRRATLRYGLAALTVALMILAPFFGPYLLDYVRDPARFVYEGGDFGFSSDLLNLVVPSQFNPLVHQLPWLYQLATRLIPPGGNGAESTTYLGWAAILLAFTGLLSQRRRAVLWLLIAMAGAVLALGPVLRVAGHEVTVSLGSLHSRVWLPYAGLMQLPLMSIGRTPGRFGTTTLLGVGILAAFGMGRLWASRLPRTALGLISALFCTLLIVEYLIWWPLPAYPTPVSPFYSDLRSEHAPGEIAILDWPMFYLRDQYVVSSADYGMIYQTVHEQRIAGGYITRWPAREKGYALGLDHLLYPERGTDALRYPAALNLADTLGRQGFDYVVVHRPITEASPADVAAQAGGLGGFLGDGEDRAWARAGLSAQLGEPVYEDEVLWAWSVAAPSQTDSALALAYFGRGWYDPQRIDGLTFRWMREPDAELYVETAAPGWVTITLDVCANGDAAIALTLDGEPVTTTQVGPEWRTVRTAPVYLPTTSSRIALHADYPADADYYVRVSNVSVEPVP